MTEGNEAGETDRKRIVIDSAVADLTRFSSAEELERIDFIDASCIVVRKSLAAAAAAIPADTDTIITVPEDVDVRSHVGMVTLGGEGLAPPDGQQHALVVVGGLIVAGAVPKVTYRQISVIGLLLVPHGSESAVGARLQNLIGAQRGYDYTKGMQVRSVAGETTLSAAMIANESGNPADILLVSGVVLIDEPIESVGYQLIMASGVLIAPRDSRDRLGSALETAGQVHWYRGAHPRLISRPETYDAAFLSLVDEPISLIVTNSLTFAEDVTVDLIRSAVADIVLTGTITVPRAAVPVVQLLARENSGRIVIAEDARV